MKFEQWNGFKEGAWQEQIAVRDFINLNYTPYDGDKSFLAGPTERTKKVMDKVNKLLKKEMDKGGVLDVDTKRVSGLLAYDAGYIDKNLDIIVGFQTDEPLKRGVNPFGGIRMARQACEAYGYKLSDEIEENFKYSTTHNDGVFSVYRRNESGKKGGNSHRTSRRLRQRPYHRRLQKSSALRRGLFDRAKESRQIKIR